MRLTRNVDKPNDCVSGMSAIVKDFDSWRGAPVVETETSQRLCIYPVTDHGVPVGRVTYHPIRLGYGDIVSKFQGADASCNFRPDRAGCPAAGYVAPYRDRVSAKTATTCWQAVSQRIISCLPCDAL